MKKYDFHGIKTYEVDKMLDNIIIEALVKNTEQIEIITGTGILQNIIIRKCNELYGYEAKIKLNNKGIVIINMDKLI